MTAQAIHLVAQRLFGNLIIFRSPRRPFLPRVAAAPAGEHQNSASVGEIEKFLRLQLSFQADRIQAHVLDVIKLIAQ